MSSSIHSNVAGGSQMLGPGIYPEDIDKIKKGDLFIYDGEEYVAWPGDMYQGCTKCDLMSDDGCLLGITLRDMITSRAVAQHLINGDRFVRREKVENFLLKYMQENYVASYMDELHAI